LPGYATLASHSSAVKKDQSPAFCCPSRFYLRTELPFAPIQESRRSSPVLIFDEFEGTYFFEGRRCSRGGV